MKTIDILLYSSLDFSIRGAYTLSEKTKAFNLRNKDFLDFHHFFSIAVSVFFTIGKFYSISLNIEVEKCFDHIFPLGKWSISQWRNAVTSDRIFP